MGGLTRWLWVCPSTKAVGRRGLTCPSWFFFRYTTHPSILHTSFTPFTPSFARLHLCRLSKGPCNARVALARQEDQNPCPVALQDFLGVFREAFDARAARNLVVQWSSKRDTVWCKQSRSAKNTEISQKAAFQECILQYISIYILSVRSVRVILAAGIRLKGMPVCFEDMGVSVRKSSLKTGHHGENYKSIITNT